MTKYCVAVSCSHEDEAFVEELCQNSDKGIGQDWEMEQNQITIVDPDALRE